MGEYDFIIDWIRFSYSSLSTYEQCHYAWKLSYIDAFTRAGNFYSDYGQLVHDTFERFFTKELEAVELGPYFRDNFDKFVVSDAPPAPPGIVDKYREQGQDFFDAFTFPLENFDVLLVEGKLDFPVDEKTLFTTRPDLVLRNHETKEITLYDYKTSAPFRVDRKTGKEITDVKKLNGYMRQMLLYTYGVRTVLGITCDKISLWFPRLGRIHSVPWKEFEEEKALRWLKENVELIRADEEWKYNNSQENSYFCNQLCGVRKFCEFRSG